MHGYVTNLEAVLIPDCLGQGLHLLDKALGAFLHYISPNVCPESLTPHLRQLKSPVMQANQQDANNVCCYGLFEIL